MSARADSLERDDPPAAMSAPHAAVPDAGTALGTAKRWLIKFGSALVTTDGIGLACDRIRGWCANIARLQQSGRQAVVVSSGAVAEGMARCGLRERPGTLHALQAVAAIGQMGLIQAYESAFKAYGIGAAQVLLTHNDLADRKRYLNARGALRALLQMGMVPVINENDSVATEEIRLGDNDTLAALTANLIDADILVLMTDQAGLFDRDPRIHPDARLIPAAAADDPGLDACAGPGQGNLGRGGMVTKLRAARLAAHGGIGTLICDGRQAGFLHLLFQGNFQGTWLWPRQQRATARKRWIAGHPAAKGTLILDAGAAAALRHGGHSLLPVGVVAVRGDFQRGDLVVCQDGSGAGIARGLINYDATETLAILGCKSSEIPRRLGYPGEQELLHRDNLVLLS